MTHASASVVRQPLAAGPSLPLSWEGSSCGWSRPRSTPRCPPATTPRACTHRWPRALAVDRVGGPFSDKQPGVISAERRSATPPPLALAALEALRRARLRAIEVAPPRTPASSSTAMAKWSGSHPTSFRSRSSDPVSVLITAWIRSPRPSSNSTPSSARSTSRVTAAPALSSGAMRVLLSIANGARTR